VSLVAAALRGLDVQRSWALIRMGLRERQAGTALSAYFRGAEMSAGTPAALAQMPSRWGVGAARLGVFAGGSLAAWSLIPRSDMLAGPAAGAAGIGAYAAAGRIPALAAKTPMGGALRAGAGLLAGSMAWQGLRSPRPEDFRL
jgi:hypothetical protein